MENGKPSRVFYQPKGMRGLAATQPRKTISKPEAEAEAAKDDAGSMVPSQETRRKIKAGMTTETFRLVPPEKKKRQVNVATPSEPF